MDVNYWKFNWIPYHMLHFPFFLTKFTYKDFSKSVTDLGLFPVLFGKDLSILSWFVYVTGIILWIVSYLFGQQYYPE